MKIIAKPQPGEYVPYAIEYISLVPDDGLLLEHLQENQERTKKLLQPLSDKMLSTPCAEREWTIKEILSHIIDAERVFAYRALCFARNEMTPLPGFDQDIFAAASGANQRSLEDLLEEYTAVRLATLALFKHLSDEAWLRTGTAMGGNPLSVRAAAYIIAGHELYHLESIKQNYLSQ